MDSQALTVFDNSDGITLLGGGGGMAGKSSVSSTRKNGLASASTSTPISARVAKATSSTGNKTPNRIANISSEASLRSASTARQGQQVARSIATKIGKRR